MRSFLEVIRAIMSTWRFKKIDLEEMYKLKAEHLTSVCGIKYSDINKCL